MFGQIGGKAAAGESLESPVGETSVLTQSPATEPEGAGLGWSDLEVAAAAFLRAISKEDDIVVTNLSASALVPALTGLRTYLAGAPYQTLYGRQPDVDAIPVRIKVSERFTSQPSDADFLELCSNGATWVWISGAATELSEDWSVFAKRQFQNEAVTLLSLNQDACGAAS